MVTQIPKETWRWLFRLSTDLYRTAPWTLMGDKQIFGFQPPNSQEKIYGTVMGQAGSYYALALYRGKGGYKSMMELLKEEESSDPEAALYEQECIMVAFEAADEADPEDQALIASVASDVVDIDRVPGFRSYQRAMMPWAIDESEALIMGEAMQICLHVAQEITLDPNWLEPGEEEEGKMRFFQCLEAGASLNDEAVRTEFPARSGHLSQRGWSVSWQEPDSLLDFSPPRLQVPSELITQAKGFPEGAHMWLFERFFFRQPSMDEHSDRPFFPVMFVLLDLETQVIRGMDVVHPLHLETQGGDVLVSLMREAGERPPALVVSNKENYILLHSMGRKMGLEIHLEEGLDVLPDIKSALYAQMDQEG